MSEEVAAQPTATDTGGADTAPVDATSSQPAALEMSSSADIAKMQEAPKLNIPEEYADRGWVKGVKTEQDLWKQLDNAQSMIGKRAPIPDAEAPQEEWDKFYKAAGRPDEPSGYELSTDIEGLPEGLDLSPHIDKTKELFHSAGLTKQQADKVWSKYLKMEIGAAEESKAAYASQAKELTSKYIGDEDKVNSLTKNTDDAIAKYLPEELHEGFGKAIGQDPLTQIAFAKMYEGMQAEINSVKEQYGAEGSIGSGDQSAGRSVDEVRSELAKLRTSDAARNFDHKDHRDTVRRIEELSGAVQKMIK